MKNRLKSLCLVVLDTNSNLFLDIQLGESTKYRIDCYLITDAIGCGVAHSHVWRLHRLLWNEMTWKIQVQSEAVSAAASNH